MHNISIGVVNLQFPLDTHIGRAHDSESIAYHTGEGALYHNGPRGQSFGDRCEIGDKIGKLRVNIKQTFLFQEFSKISNTFRQNMKFTMSYV